MARTLNKSSLMSFPVPLSRMDAFPLDANSFFETLAAAETYAASHATAYVGQLLTVVTSSGVDLYKIKNADGTLEKVPDESRISEVAAAAAAGIADTGFQGSFSECIASSSFTFKKGMIFLVDSAAIYNSSDDTGYLDGGSSGAIELGYAVEAGDFLIFKGSDPVPALLARQTFKVGQNYRTLFTSNFSIWQANLHGAVTKITGTSGSGKYVSGLQKSGDTISFETADLPVKQVVISGSGNNVTGVSYFQGVLTLTKGDISVPTTKEEHLTVVASTLSSNRIVLQNGPAVGEVLLFVNGIKAPQAWFSLAANNESISFNTNASGFDIVVGDSLSVVYQA